jgi:hypothetical protein
MGLFPRGHHIRDADFLDAMKRARALRPEQLGVSRFDIASVLGGMAEQVEANARDPLADYVSEVPGVNERAVLRTARKLIKRKVINGCDCGCPGYFTFAGEELPVSMWLSETGA